MPRALFRFDVGPGHGAGHMARCLAVAEQLEARGYACMCAVNDSGIEHLPERYREPALAMSGAEDTDLAVIAAAAAPAFDLAVIDHYQIARPLETRLRSHAHRIAVIDDLADRDHDADVLVDPAPGQHGERYAERLPARALRLLGPDYALLRAEYPAKRQSPAQRETSPADGWRILVALGAVDSRNVTASVLEGLRRVPGIGLVTTVLGRGAPHIASIQALVATLPFAARLLVDARDMADLILRHDLGIGAPGVSALERACLGLPQILIQIADNQATAAAGFASTGAGLFLGAAASPADGRIAAAVGELLAHPDKLHALGRSARAVVDGKGANRVAAILASAPADRQGRALAARRIRASDADVLYRWQCDPSTRRYFVDTSVPSRHDHDRFIASRLASDERTTEIVTRDGVPVAIVRADPAETGREVSIVVSPDCRGEGIGRAALGYLDALEGPAALTALVDSRNAASLALFGSAGYGRDPKRRLRLLGRDGAHAGYSQPVEPA